MVSTFALGDNPFIPRLGASGAILGVMNGDLLIPPNGQARVIILRMLTTGPGLRGLGLWFVLQVISAYVLGHQSPAALDSTIRLLDQPFSVQSFGDILETGRVSEEKING